MLMIMAYSRVTIKTELRDVTWKEFMSSILLWWRQQGKIYKNGEWTQTRLENKWGCWKSYLKSQVGRASTLFESINKNLMKIWKFWTVSKIERKLILRIINWKRNSDF